MTCKNIESRCHSRAINRHGSLHSDERGIALVTVLLVMLVVGALTSAAAVIGGNHVMIDRYYERESQLEMVADAGLEVARAAINANTSLYPADGFTTLESDVTVYDGAGSPIPGVTRSLYVGPSGVTTGQYGVFGSIVAVVRDAGGGVAVRRREIYQESFAKYAYFTDIEPTNISFGGGDQIFGPVHTNSDLKIYSSGATFHGKARTAGIVIGASYATFHEGYETGVARIEMPETAELTKMRTQAQQGNMHFIGNGNGGQGEASMRIEFVALDLNNDGSLTGETEGFIKVYASNNEAWLSASRPTSGSGLRNSRNCGFFIPSSSGSLPSWLTTDYPGRWVSADLIGDLGYSWWTTTVTSSSSGCYLGGSDPLNAEGDVNNPYKGGRFLANDGRGSWIPWGGAVPPGVAATLELMGRSAADALIEAQYYHPISRAFNPTWKGVIHVDGKVGVSGVLRGRVTLSASDDIIILDDVTYAGGAGNPACDDILGLFSGDDVVLSDNTLLAPQRPITGWNHRTYDDTKDEFIHAVILALDLFTVQNYNSGSTNDEHCESTTWGRGCLYLTGGIIQRTRGAVGTTAGTGSLKRYSYDTCGASDPPPYFPTTGHFVQGQYFQVDPTGFDITAYFDRLRPTG